MSNIEDDIEKIKTFADYSQEVLNDMEYEKPVDVTITQKEVNAINNLLSEREQDKARIKALELQNKQLEYYIEELKKYNKTVSDRIIEYKKNSIPKQKVKDVLNDIYDYFERLNGPDEDIEYIESKRKELLEEGE